MSDLSRHFLVCKFGSHVFIFFHLFFFLPLFLTQNASARLVRALLKNLSQVGYHILVSTLKNLKNDFRKRMSACFSFLVFLGFFFYKYNYCGHWKWFGEPNGPSGWFLLLLSRLNPSAPLCAAFRTRNEFQFVLFRSACAHIQLGPIQIKDIFVQYITLYLGYPHIYMGIRM